MLDAHSDEVGFMVHSVCPNGTLRAVDLDRRTNSTLPASKVKVKNAADAKWGKEMLEGMADYISEFAPVFARVKMPVKK